MKVTPRHRPASPRPGRSATGAIGARRGSGRKGEGSAGALPAYAAGLLSRAGGVRLLLLDVDGVLTDGGLYYGASGEVLKAFHARDGLGLARVRQHVELGVISGRPDLARARLAELKFAHLLFSQRDKLAAYATLAPLGFADTEVAFMGDDVNDLGLMRRVGLSACPSDAHPLVLAEARFVARLPGGRGAVRELVDLILSAKGVSLEGG